MRARGRAVLGLWAEDCGCVLRKPLVVSRIALEGLIIKRTVAAAARALSSRADGVHRRGARAALCNQLLKRLPTLRWRKRGGQ